MCEGVQMVNINAIRRATKLERKRVFISTGKY